MAKKKAAKKVIHDPIDSAAQDLKSKLKRKRSELEQQFRVERNPVKQQNLKLKIRLINNIVDDLDLHILHPVPFTHFMCP